jgi:hypothetical protein
MALPGAGDLSCFESASLSAGRLVRTLLRCCVRGRCIRPARLQGRTWCSGEGRAIGAVLKRPSARSRHRRGIFHDGSRTRFADAPACVSPRHGGGGVSTQFARRCRWEDRHACRSRFAAAEKPAHDDLLDLPFAGIVAWRRAFAVALPGCRAADHSGWRQWWWHWHELWSWRHRRWRRRGRRRGIWIDRGWRRCGAGSRRLRLAGRNRR